VELSEVDFATRRKVEKYNQLQIILEFLTKALCWPLEHDPLRYATKYELEITDASSSLSRNQNPNYLKFADGVNIFVKQMLLFIEKHYKGGITWLATGPEAPQELKFSIHGSLGIISYCSRPSITASRIQETRSKWVCEFQDKKTIDYDPKDKSCYIFQCVGTSVTLFGKSDSIHIEQCENTTINFNDSASITIKNCKNMLIQCTGVVNIMNIVETHGGLIIINEKCTETNFVTQASTRLYTKNSNSNNEIFHVLPFKTSITVKKGDSPKLL